ncbi:hypothetical protein IJT93_03565 [bacterium]|nr:hypothetical protein [bacterium]
MRRKFFGWIAVSLCAAAAAVSGCSGSGGDASEYVVPSIPGMDVGQRYLSYLVNDYKSTDDCRLVVTTAGTDEADTTARDVKVSTNADYASGKVDAEEEDSAVKKDGREAVPCVCGFDDIVRRDMKCKMDAVSLKKLSAKADKAPSFAGKEAGYVDYLWVVGQGDEEDQGYTLVPVAKVLDDEDTVHCNILSHVETDENGIMTPAVSREEALIIAKVFDSYNPADPSGKNTGIYDAVTSKSGHEWKKGGGRDGDPRINIVLLTSESMGSGLLGYVTPTDILHYVDPNDEDADPTYSNQGEYLYINYGDIIEAGGVLNGTSLAHTLAHEFTHEVYLNQKFFHDGNMSGYSVNDSYAEFSEKYLPNKETLLVSEGLAETNATRCGFGVRYAMDGSSAAKCAEYNSLYFISSYLSDSGEVTTFPVSFFQTTSATAYPAGHLFGLHVLQYYGEDKLNKLYTSPYTGIKNLEEALGLSAADVIHNYNLAVSLAGYADIPAKYEIPYVNIGGDNYYTSTSAYTIDTMAVNRAAAVGKIYTKTGYNTKSFLPWYNGLLDLPCNYSSPLGVGVVVPDSAKVNLIRTDSYGKFVDMY